MGRYSAYKLLSGAIVTLMLTMLHPAFAYDMERGMSAEAEKAYSDAYSLFDKGDYDSALEKTETYLSESGQEHGLLYLLAGNIYLKQRKLDKAYMRYKEAAEAYGDNADVYATAGRIALNLKHLSDAEQCMEKAMELGDESSDVLRILADIYVKSGRLSEAGRILSRLDELNDRDRKMLLYVYAKTGQIRRARHMLHHLVSSSRDDWWKLYGLYVMDKAPKEAAAAFRIYVKSADVDPEELRMISSLFASQKVYDEAYDILSGINSTAKTCRDYHTQGQMGYKLGRLEDSEKVLEESLHKGCMKESGATLAYVYYRKHKYDRAARIFENFGDKPEMLYMAALSRYKNGDYKAAQGLLKKLSDSRKLKNKVSKLHKLIGDRNDN